MKHLKLYEQFRLILEAIYDDVAVRISNKKRGVCERDSKSFDIFFNNKEVMRKMMTHKMGKPGSMQSFSYEGPDKWSRDNQYTKYEWTADTTAWEVWKHMNYIVLTPLHEIHWYHGKSPGFSTPEYLSQTNHIVNDGSLSKNEVLPKLDIKKLGFKVYSALLDDPNVGYILSDKGSSVAVKTSVYQYLFNNPKYIWIKSGDPKILSIDPLKYDKVVIMNPKYCNPKEVEENFRNLDLSRYIDPNNPTPTQPNLNAVFTYSDNFKK